MDLVCMGRVAVDFYARQQGASLVEAQSFSRAVGGSSANLAIGAARLGVATAMVSRVGSDPMGEFVRASLRKDGVDLSALSTDTVRRTALAFLGMDDPEATGLDFYRHDAADQAIEASQVPSNMMSTARCLAVTGTQFATAGPASPAHEITRGILAGGAELVLDIDLRRGLWAGSKGGMPAATERVLGVAGNAGVIVGNEEEICTLGGETDLIRSLHALRSVFSGLIVVKLGVEGAALIPDRVPSTRAGLDITPAIPVRAVNPVGAGDAFLAAFLAARLDGRDPRCAVSEAVIAGAIVAARPDCSASLPFRQELEEVRAGVPADAQELLRLNQRKRRGKSPVPILALACDHRVPFDQMVAEHGRHEADAIAFKSLVVEAARATAIQKGLKTGAMFLDPRLAGDAISALTRNDWWVALPAEATGSRPIRFELGDNLGGTVETLHPRQAVKCLVWHHPTDDVALSEEQFSHLRSLQGACEQNDKTWVLELIPSHDSAWGDMEILASVDQAYDAGLRPSLWKLPGLKAADSWDRLGGLIRRCDPMCEGVLVLGLDRPLAEIEQTLSLAAQGSICAGFAIGRTIFGDVARHWLARGCTDEEAVSQMATTYGRLIDAFLEARAGASKAMAVSG